MDGRRGSADDGARARDRYAGTRTRSRQRRPEDTGVCGRRTEKRRWRTNFLHEHFPVDVFCLLSVLLLFRQRGAARHHTLRCWPVRSLLPYVRAHNTRKEKEKTRRRSSFGGIPFGAAVGSQWEREGKTRRRRIRLRRRRRSTGRHAGGLRRRPAADGRISPTRRRIERSAGTDAATNYRASSGRPRHHTVIGNVTPLEQNGFFS